MAKSVTQISAQERKQEADIAKNLESIRDALGFICIQYDIEKQDTERYQLSISEFKPDFEGSTRDLLNTLDKAVFPADSINKICTHYWKCVLESLDVGFMLHRNFMTHQLQSVRIKLFLNLVGIEYRQETEDFKVDSSKSILNTHQPIQLRLGQL